MIAFCLISGCKHRVKIPAGIIPPDKMEKVLWDMIRADQYVSAYILPKDSTKDEKTESIRLYQKIFDIHGITREDFRKSFIFYRSNPVLLRAVADSLNNSMQSSFNRGNPSYTTDTSNKRVKMAE
jgi:hypothetical protein